MYYNYMLRFLNQKSNICSQTLEKSSQKNQAIMGKRQRLCEEEPLLMVLCSDSLPSCLLNAHLSLPIQYWPFTPYLIFFLCVVKLLCSFLSFTFNYFFAGFLSSLLFLVNKGSSFSVVLFSISFSYVTIQHPLRQYKYSTVSKWMRMD